MSTDNTSDQMQVEGVSEQQAPEAPAGSKLVITLPSRPKSSGRVEKKQRQLIPKPEDFINGQDNHVQIGEKVKTFTHWCTYHHGNTSHITEDCHKLKNDAAKAEGKPEPHPTKKKSAAVLARERRRKNFFKHERLNKLLEG